MSFHNARLVSITPNAEKLIAYCARVSSPNQSNKKIEKLLAYCAAKKHWSVYEMAHMTLEINTTRAIEPQILRHKSFSFQSFCLSGDSRISCISGIKLTSNIKYKTIKYLFEIQNKSKNRWNKRVRVFDERTKEFTTGLVKEIFQTGIKDLYELKTVGGKVIKTTKEHKFLCDDYNWKPLSELSPGNFIGVNGVPCHHNKEWLIKAKQEAIDTKKGLPYIAQKAGVSYHTIRKWMGIHGLQFTAKEKALYVTVWNKGLPKEQQPNYRNSYTVEQRQKMSLGQPKGQDSHLYKNGNSQKHKRTFNMQTRDTSYRCKYSLSIDHGSICQSCKQEFTLKDLSVDHVVPVNKNPLLAHEYNNFQLLCKPCHKIKSKTESNKKSNSWDVIESITYVGKEMTYDMEIDRPNHNYVANKICVHNSQRYSDPSADSDNPLPSLVDSVSALEFRLQDYKNRQNSIEMSDEEKQSKYVDSFLARSKSLAVAANKLYSDMIKTGIAFECARNILPAAQPTRLYMSGNIRSWIHYLQIRTEEATQKEHRMIAESALLIFKENLPLIAKTLFEND